MKVSQLPWCARCGPDTPHPSDELEITPFKKPVEDTDGTVWTHWALCPVTGDPVLFIIHPDESASV